MKKPIPHSLQSPTLKPLSERARALGWTIELKQFCEDGETPGFLGQIAGVACHARKAIKIKTHQQSEETVAAVIEHELRHVEGADHAGDDPERGLRCGGHRNVLAAEASEPLQ